MKLGEFIEKFVAKNTLVRLWKPIDASKPYGNKIMLTQKRCLMEWEILEIPRLAVVMEMVFVADIFCEKDRESVNIVVQTDYTPEDVDRMIADFERRREIERANCCEA